jgi:hypothetical protein
MSMWGMISECRPLQYSRYSSLTEFIDSTALQTPERRARALRQHPSPFASRLGNFYPPDEVCLLVSNDIAPRLTFLTETRPCFVVGTLATFLRGLAFLFWHAYGLRWFQHRLCAYLEVCRATCEMDADR